MAKQRLPVLSQKHVIQETEEENGIDLQAEVVNDDWIDSLQNHRVVEGAEGGYITSGSAESTENHDGKQLDTNPSYMRQVMDKDYLIKPDNQSMCNGDLQHNILSSENLAGEDKQTSDVAITLCDSSHGTAATNHSFIADNVRSTTPSIVIKQDSTVSNNKILCNGGGRLQPLSAGCSPASSFRIVKKRKQFTDNRSASTEGSEKNQDTTQESEFHKASSDNSSLIRTKSFDRGAKVVPKNSLVRLNVGDKFHPRYESAISDIGVDYMKATGVIGIRFKQLQKPENYSIDSQTGIIGLRFKQLQKPEPPNLEVIPASTAVRHMNNDLPDQDCKKAAQTPVNDIVIPISITNSSCKGNDGMKQEYIETEKNANRNNHVGYRLGQRKILAEKRRRIADLSCVFALCGLVLMIIETECSIAQLYSKYDTASYLVKGLISGSTLVLLILITLYHSTEIKLFVVDNCIEDWRIAVSWRRILQIGAELIICAIHPLPIPYHFTWTIFDIKIQTYRSAEVPIDVVLSLPMFVRLYHIVRVMLLHSKLFTDASSRSIGALNKITFNTTFVLKTLMTIFPATVMAVVMMSLWIIFAWTIRACESYHDPVFSNLLNTLYMIAITFLSVGYGDITPNTYCGRAIAVASGLMGNGCTAITVAVVASKLDLTRAEKHVHNFMLETQLSKKLKDAAANVLRETWLIYKYTRLVRRVNSSKIRVHQRKFLSAIHQLRKVKLKQRKLADQANSLTDFSKTANQVHELVNEFKLMQHHCEKRIEKIEDNVSRLQSQLNSLPHAIAHAIIERQLSQTSFISSDMQEMQHSPINPRRLHPGMATSAQSSFDSYG